MCTRTIMLICLGYITFYGQLTALAAVLCAYRTWHHSILQRYLQLFCVVAIPMMTTVMTTESELQTQTSAIVRH